MRLLHPYQVFVVSLVVVVLAISSFASAKDQDDIKVEVAYVPRQVILTDTGPVLPVSAYGIFDVETGQVLAAQKPNDVLPIASITKLLTASVVLRTLVAEGDYTVTESDLLGHGRAGRLSVGESYEARELLFPLLLESSNDAAVLYERVTKGDIVRQMNTYAADLGATSLQVVDASGLSDQNQASVRDLIKLTTELYAREPHLFDIMQLSQRSGPYVSWRNNSPVWDKSYRGGKHGYTEAANRTIVALFEEEFAEGGTKTVGYVVLGSSDLASDVATLREFIHQKAELK